eukprot:759184-Amphidinium_carterae.1
MFETRNRTALHNWSITLPRNLHPFVGCSGFGARTKMLFGESERFFDTAMHNGYSMNWFGN